jgi:hypothetical protein
MKRLFFMPSIMEVGFIMELIIGFFIMASIGFSVPYPAYYYCYYCDYYN